MLRRTADLDAFEARLRRRPVDYAENLRIFELLWEEARELGVIPARPSLAGLEHDIRYARAIHRLAAPRRARP